MNCDHDYLWWHDILAQLVLLPVYGYEQPGRKQHQKLQYKTKVLKLRTCVYWNMLWAIIACCKISEKYFLSVWVSIILYLSIYICFTDGGRDGLRWPALSGHWLSCAGFWLYLLSMKWLMYGILFLHISTSLGCFCSWTICQKTYWTIYLDLLYMRLSKWFPWGVWGRGWTTFLLYDGPPLGLGFLIVSWCQSFIWRRDIFLLISCFIHVLFITRGLPIIFPLKLIYSEIAFLW